MPCDTMLWGESPAIFLLPRKMLPWDGFRMPDIVIRQVDFPAPLLPIRETISPFLTSISMPLIALIGPYDVWIASILSIGSVRLLAEICLDHQRIVPYFRGYALRDLYAMVKDNDTV